MTQLSKIAILNNDDSGLTFELAELQESFSRMGINSKVFYNSQSILEYQPSCVIVTSPQEAKLTPYPTYGLLNKPKGEYLELARFLRNLMTYDGYLTFSDQTKQMVGDVMFGLRKLGSSIVKLDVFPASTEFKKPNLDNDNKKFIIFEPDFNRSKFKSAIYSLLRKFENISLVTFSIPDLDQYSKQVIVAKNTQHLSDIINQHGIVVCLNSGTNKDGYINPVVIKAIASSAVTIVQQTDLLESYFKDNLYYIPADTSSDLLYKLIELHLKSIFNKPDIAIQKCQNAHKIFLEHFAFDKQFPLFKAFHEKTLIDKGYMPDPDLEAEKKLPSVSYIIRTGGKHRPYLERTLDCLVEQQYPDLRVIFVIHAHFPYIEELKQKYSSLKIKVVEAIKSRRSEAIRDGMAAVETELFGLFDDDDEIFPNHVRMLVKTLQYHANRDWRGEIGMVYSGSIHADDTYAVLERAEYRDHKWINKNEKRAIEHFRLYSSRMMSQHAWFMPNGWLARSKFIDNELLEDPQLDTCEDLYFELQIAQRAHFAFSAEVTAIHHFHHLGNSTIDDSHKHIPDTERIALRNFSRVFPYDSAYDWEYNSIGRPYALGQPEIAYQDTQGYQTPTSWFTNPFFPFRKQYIHPNAPAQAVATVAYSNAAPLRRLIKLPIKIAYYGIKFAKLDRSRKSYFINKFKLNVKQYGYLYTLNKVVFFVRNGYLNLAPAHAKEDHFSKREFLNRWFGWFMWIFKPAKKFF